MELSGHRWPGLLEMTMTVFVTGSATRDDVTLVPRHLQYIANTRFERPTLVIDSEAVRQYMGLARGLGRARIHYAVKANPAPEILRRLCALGSNFDAASLAEIEMCRAAGASAARIPSRQHHQETRRHRIRTCADHPLYGGRGGRAGKARRARTGRTYLHSYPR